MATLTAIVGSTSVVLSDGNPYALLSAKGMGGAPIERVTLRGPAQHGDTDYGYRLRPREIELEIGFKATTDALLDGYRDTLTHLFKPLTSTVVTLRYTRDDGEVRQLDCYSVAAVQIDLVPEYRPGHYHRATVHLYAPDPAFYRQAPGTATVTGTVNFDTNWWLAGGAIPSSSVQMHGGTPALDEAFSFAGSIAAVGGWTLAVNASYVSPAGTQAYMFSGTAADILTNYPRFGVAGTNVYGGTSYVFGRNVPMGTTQMVSGGFNVYMAASDPSGYDFSDGSRNSAYKHYWETQTGGGLSAHNENFYLDGNTTKWRRQGWSGTVLLYALYSPPLTYAQRSALRVYMSGGTSGTISQAVAVAYEGDLPEYPVISLTGPITAPYITNTATGETLNFGTNVIGAGTTYVIDTRYGQKTVLYGTVSKIDQLSDDSDLGTWHLAPNPVATGGTNVIVVGGSALTGATSVSIVYYHRFQGR